MTLNKDYKDNTMDEFVGIRLFPEIRAELASIRAANRGRWENESHQIRAAINSHIRKYRGD